MVMDSDPKSRSPNHSPKVSATGARDLAARAERIKEAIALLQQEIQQLELEGNIAPTDTWVMRYKAHSRKGYYWYYKLQAREAIFPQATDSNKQSKYKHLGKAGSPEHIEAVMQVARRGKIDALQRGMSSLYESWLSLYSESQPEPTPPNTSK